MNFKDEKKDEQRKLKEERIGKKTEYLYRI